MTAVGDKKINVIDMVNKSRNEMAYNIIDVESEPTAGIVNAIASVAGVKQLRVL